MGEKVGNPQNEISPRSLLAAIQKGILLERGKMPPEIHLVFRLGQALGFFPFTVEGDSRRLAFNWYRILLLKGLIEILK